MRPNGSTLIAPPNPRLSRRRTSSSGSSGPFVRPTCKGPLQEPRLQEGYNECRYSSMDNCRSDLLHQGRNYYSSLAGLPQRLCTLDRSVIVSPLCVYITLDD